MFLLGFVGEHRITTVAFPQGDGLFHCGLVIGLSFSPGLRGGHDGPVAASRIESIGEATIAAYRKIAANRERLDEYYDAVDDVPSQSDFIRFCGADGNSTASRADSPNPGLPGE